MSTPLPLGEQQSISNTENGYWLVDHVQHDVHSAQLIHHDATTAGTWTVYSTNRLDAPIPGAAATPDLEYWSLESPTITSPAGGAAGSFMLHLSGSGARRYLVRFLASAASECSVYTHGKA